MKKPRFYSSLGILTAVLLVVLFLPLPHSVICPLELQTRDAHPIYVDVPGKLISLDVKPGQQVIEGQQLAQLRSIDIDLEIAKLQGQVDEYRMKLEGLRQQSFRDRRAAAEIPTVQEAIKTVEDQLENKSRDQQRLRLVAPAAGTVLPPPVTPRRDDPDEKLPIWSGTPLQPENIGAYLEAGAVFCQVGDPKRLEAVLIVDQSDRNLVHEGLPVDIKLEGFPHRTLYTEIKEIAESELKVSPQRLSVKSGGELATKTDPNTGAEKPMSTSYQARSPIDDADGLYQLGLRGQARVHTAWISLGTRLWRLLSHTFNFKL